MLGWIFGVVGGLGLWCSVRGSGIFIGIRFGVCCSCLFFIITIIIAILTSSNTK
jgi:hypothetical protein